MDRKQKRTVIGIQQQQPQFNFEEAERSPAFAFPEYQRELLSDRFVAGLADFLIVAFVFAILPITAYVQFPDQFSIDRRALGIFAIAFLLLVAVYFFLFMLGASQTPGMRWRGLAVVTADETPLGLYHACFRGFGYLISILPVMLGFVWAVVDPEHLTWADKVSGTYVKRL